MWGNLSFIINVDGARMKKRKEFDIVFNSVNACLSYMVSITGCHQCV